MKRPVVWTEHIELPLPTSEDKRADLERLTETLGLTLEVPLPLLRRLPALLRENGFALDLKVAKTTKEYKLLGINQNRPVYAVAIDIGSTNIVGSLWELDSGKKVREDALKNPQIAFGPDILSRMHLAMSGRLKELSDALIGGVNDLIKKLAEGAGIGPEDIYYGSFCGNTVMTHFLLCLPVDYIPVEPYIPVVHRPATLIARELSIEINPEAPVYVFPNAGSYVGGDIISGIVATGIHRSETPKVLLDIGTNGEVVIGTKDWIFVGSGAAGPALEAGVLKAGMAAKEGAIYRVDLKDGKFHLKTIGNVPPVGICGSGVIDLIAELYREGWIDPYGRFTEKARTEELDGSRVVVVHEDEAKKITVTEDEIENFLRSKAGMFTTLYVMVTDLGLRFSDIEEFYIAGAMGTGVRLKQAKLLGMLPQVPDEKVKPVGNSALKGAEALLLDENLIEEIDRIHGLITYKEMNTDTRFMGLFRSAMVIPHAEPSMLL